MNTVASPQQQREQAKAAQAAKRAVLDQRRAERRATRPGCHRESPRCTSAVDPKVATRECCRKWNVEVLGAVAEAFDAAGIRWWIDYGTLLGYKVNGGLYWNDKDTDVGVHADDREKVLGPVADALRRKGHIVTYSAPKASRFGGGDRLKVRLSLQNHTNCDVFFWGEQKGTLDRSNYIGVDRFKGREFPTAWALPVTQGQWEGIEVAVPADAEQLVAHRYGERWRNLPPARTDGRPR